MKNEIIVEIFEGVQPISDEALFEFERLHPKQLQWDIEHKREIIDDPSTILIYARVEGALCVGELILQKVGEEVYEVRSITVLPQYRGNGIANAMVERMIEVCVDRKIKHVFGRCREGASTSVFERYDALLHFPIKDYYGTGATYFSFSISIFWQKMKQLHSV